MNMIEKSGSLNFAMNLVLLAGLLFILVPLYFVITTASHSFESFLQNGIPLLPGTHLFDNIRYLISETAIPKQILNSLMLALLVALGKCFFAYITAFGLVFFSVKYTGVIFGFILVTVMLPIDVRVVTTYQVISDMNLLNTYIGLAFPLIAHGTGTFMFRQFFKTIPSSLPEAARMDGAGPFRFAVDILLPLSKSTFAALFILMFLGGWNAYLWPLVASSTPAMHTAVVGLAKLQPSSDGEIANFPVIMSAVLMISVVPMLIIALLQKHVSKGLSLSEK